MKDVRRRVVESVLEGVGASEKTVDEVFDNHHAHFKTMLDDLNECKYLLLIVSYPLLVQPPQLI